MYGNLLRELDFLVLNSSNKYRLLLVDGTQLLPVHYDSLNYHRFGAAFYV